MRLKTSLLALSAAVLLGTAATSRAIDSFSLNFDGAGNVAEAFAPLHVTIGYGIYTPTFDGFGDPVAGSDHWEIDASAGSVPVIDPSTVGWGAAPSLSKALDARDGTVLITFDQPLSISGFHVTLDNSTFGNLFDSPIEFYDASHQLLHTASVNQTTPGYTVNTGAIANVATIVLPSSAFYDNLAITAVPEPGTWAIAVGAVGLVALRAFRRRVA